MSKKDFVAIANIFASVLEVKPMTNVVGIRNADPLRKEYVKLALELANHCETNPRFDRVRFLTACGLNAVELDFDAQQRAA